ncbi:alpha-amylase-like [Cylas formicarius]|uniref:alpha-amylase-like n=1 Tax=Cylas formicarius TaxID=197179 RepID=UPI002958465C|nr:alpha-amylase-like [Cylas formicarius]
MRAVLLVTLAAVASSSVLAQKDPHFVDGRNTIVHLFEWKWADIAAECENFLSKKRFGGIQISPPSENVIIDNPYRPWWERYQPISYSLTTRSGDEGAFADMVRRCNQVGIRIYVDLVVNHMAATSGTGTAGSNCDAGSKWYPAVSYSNENFHGSCDIDYNDANSIRNCELSGLKDLDQSQDYVRGKIRDYMNHLIGLGVAGFRVDAAKHMWPSDLEAIFNSVDNLNSEFFGDGARAYYYQEVIDTGNDPVYNTEYIGFGDVIEFKHGAQLGNAFKGNNPLHYLSNWGTGWGLIDGSNALVMIDNHDTQRNGDFGILNYKDSKLYKAATAFMLAHSYDATTQVMSSFGFESSDDGPPNNNGELVSPGFTDDGTCTNGWICEHRWRQIFNMVEFRSVVAGTGLNDWWDNGDNQVAFSRGDKGFAAFTISGDINESIQTGLPAGTYCDVISGGLENGRCTGKSVSVDGNSRAQVSLSAGEDDAVLAIHVNAKL